jgi:caa(3)-type oxidase subunit IV
MGHEKAHSPLDLTDPHHDLHHGHVIIPPRTLVAVLLVLLVFTVLTVAASRGEVWLSHAFHVVIPQSVNVGVVLFIAVIKSALVAMYFMQLRYDSAVNTIIFLFCLFAVGLFLFFSMVDLGQRGTIYAWKSGEILPGGLGINSKQQNHPDRGVDTENLPIKDWARKKRLEAIAAKGVADPAAQYKLEEELFAEHKEHPGAEPEPVSTPNKSVPRTGVTPDLYKPKAAGSGAEGGGHGH